MILNTFSSGDKRFGDILRILNDGKQLVFWKGCVSLSCSRMVSVTRTRSRAGRRIRLSENHCAFCANDHQKCYQKLRGDTTKKSWMFKWLKHFKWYTLRGGWTLIIFYFFSEHRQCILTYNKTLLICMVQDFCQTHFPGNDPSHSWPPRGGKHGGDRSSRIRLLDGRWWMTSDLW